MDHKLSVIKTSQFPSGSCAVSSQFSLMFHNRGTPSAGLWNSVKKRVVCVCDKCANGSNRNASVRTEEAVGVAQETISRIQKQSLAQQIGGSPSTIWNICCDDCRRFRHNATDNESAIVGRWNNKTLTLSRGPAERFWRTIRLSCNVTLLSDEADFHLNGQHF
jgi:hypothetical protein